MFAVTATVHPRESTDALHLLEQRLRRHFMSVRVDDDSLIILFPNVGRVLVTEKVTTMRLDFVAESPDVAAKWMIALEQQLREQVEHQSLTIRWDRPDSVPVTLR